MHRTHTHTSQAISGEVRITLWLWETSSVANEWRVPFALGPLDSRQVFDSSISSLTSVHCKSRASCVLSLTATDSTQQELSSNIFYLTPLVNVSIQLHFSSLIFFKFLKYFKILNFFICLDANFLKRNVEHILYYYNACRCPFPRHTSCGRQLPVPVALPIRQWSH